jgi:hypothetical protein
MTNATIEVSTFDFVNCHAGLVQMLEALSKAGSAGMSTRQVCNEVFGSRSYGLKIICRAETDGYIERSEEGKLVVNRLSVRGRRLIDKISKSQ